MRPSLSISDFCVLSENSGTPGISHRDYWETALYKWIFEDIFNFKVKFISPDRGSSETLTDVVIYFSEIWADVSVIFRRSC